MYFKFNSLTLQCKKERVLIDLSHKISFFHGKIGSGKSSLVRLIDFCLGSSLEKTSAIRQELISSTLNLQVGENNVILERTIDTASARVTWKNEDRESATVLAPINSGNNPIWLTNIYNLSDLLFFLLGMNPPMARKSKLQDESKLIRVSFRDFMWYSYLDQDHIDSSFFRLEDTFRRNKSRDVMRYVMGYHSVKLSEYEQKLYDYRDQLNNAKSNSENLYNLLSKFDFGSIDEMNNTITEEENKLFQLRAAKKKLEEGYQKETHIANSLRDNARTNFKRLGNCKDAIDDLKNRIEEQNTLKNELIASKFKLARSISIAHVLDNVKFDLCPSCGHDIKEKKKVYNSCYLCHSEINLDKQNLNAETIKLDMDSRIDELENSISIHKRELEKQKKLLKFLIDDGNKIDNRINDELKKYDSKYLSSFREIDANIATIKERIKGHERLKKIPQEIKRIEKRIQALNSDITDTKRNIELEKSKLSKSDKYIQQLEKQFLDTMILINFPGIEKNDIVRINRGTWNVYILPEGKEDGMWSFENAGSGGKKTLFNVSYLLSLHIVASKNNLALPNFIIIDTPMKNIGEDVNDEIFKNFYKFLYNVAVEELEDTQFIIIDKDYIMPEFEVDLYDRYMTPDNPEYPPLIPYYKGA